MKGGRNPTNGFNIMKNLNEKKEKSWILKSVDSAEYEDSIQNTIFEITLSILDLPNFWRSFLWNLPSCKMEILDVS